MGNRIWANMLNYGVLEGKWVRRIPVRSGGVRDELGKLHLSLQKDYGWTEDQGCVFVLTDITPYLPGIHLETVVQGEHPAASRITLVIDPVIAPQAVLDSYGRLRQKILMGRYRPLSEKHLKLAVFAAERRPPSSWAEVMELWNAEHEEDRYAVETTFARDCAAAQRRLLKPKLNPDGLEELVAESEE